MSNPGVVLLFLFLILTFLPIILSEAMLSCAEGLLLALCTRIAPSCALQVLLEECKPCSMSCALNCLQEWDPHCLEEASSGFLLCCFLLWTALPTHHSLETPEIRCKLNWKIKTKQKPNKKRMQKERDGHRRWQLIIRAQCRPDLQELQHKDDLWEASCWDEPNVSRLRGEALPNLKRNPMSRLCSATGWKQPWEKRPNVSAEFDPAGTNCSESFLERGPKSGISVSRTLRCYIELLLWWEEQPASIWCLVSVV